jgi:UDP-N-acetylglucosamine--N-acetylmuramyl-(pentapeptide) pyrophosphoryl-undecaprenol N-acetylglucosamine transferase
VPGIAVARAAEAAGDACLFVTAGRPVEETILGGMPHRTLGLERGSGAPGKLSMALAMPAALRRAGAILREFSPDAVLGLGGLVSFPVALAARLRGVPVALLEINAVPGRATRWLKPCAHRVFVASAAAAARCGSKARFTGTPLRGGFIQLPDRRDARESFGLDRDRFTMAVFGGSQGALAVNRAVAGILPKLASGGIQLLWVAGPGKDVQAESACRATPGLRATVLAWLDDAPRAYAAADLALCRTGAATVAELAAAGVPAIGVPYPHHRDRQQYWNAESLGDGILVMDERALTPETLASTVLELRADRERLECMSRECRRRGVGDAASRVLQELRALSGKS